MRQILTIADPVIVAAERDPDAIAIRHAEMTLTYNDLAHDVDRFAHALLTSGHRKGDRVAIFSHKCFEAAIALLGASRTGCIFVPINPLLKPAQVAHILNSCKPRSFVTTVAGANDIQAVLSKGVCPDFLVLIDEDVINKPQQEVRRVAWRDFIGSDRIAKDVELNSSDAAAILYTSGSTGRPKGVVVSHSNLLTGASSVAEYLGHCADDRILAVLPLSFDAGLSQLTTTFHSGATVVLHNYLLPQDVMRIIEQDGITGITGVPSLWIQLMSQGRSSSRGNSLRYFANTGGKLPGATLHALRVTFPYAKPYLMYGFTEAFRSTYLPPEDIDTRQESIGKAIPNANIYVVNPDGKLCKPGEPGELVHQGPLVTLGYWNDPDASARTFRPISHVLPFAPSDELAAWSGDTVTLDADGYLYFIGRRDAMIKTSGYRVSPTEIEAIVAQTPFAKESVAFGVLHPRLGQAIVLVVVPKIPGKEPTDDLTARLRSELPGYMLPQKVVWRDSLPLNVNGKPDRASLAAEFHSIYADERIE